MNAESLIADVPEGYLREVSEFLHEEANLIVRDYSGDHDRAGRLRLVAFLLADLENCKGDDL